MGRDERPPPGLPRKTSAPLLGIILLAAALALLVVLWNLFLH